LWDSQASDPFAKTNLPVISPAMRKIMEATKDAPPIDRAIAVLSQATEADPRAYNMVSDGRADIAAGRGRDDRRGTIPRSAAQADRARLGAAAQTCRRSYPPRAGAAGRSRIERIDIHGALRRLHRHLAL